MPTQLKNLSQQGKRNALSTWIPMVTVTKKLENPMMKKKQMNLQSTRRCSCSRNRL